MFAGDLTNGRIAITEHWRPEKLWDADAPNQYVLSVSLVEVRSAVLAGALPVHFGLDFGSSGSRGGTSI